MSTWKIAIWMLSTLGVAGTVALFVVYPTIMASIWRGIIKLFGFVLSYRLGCALVAAIVAGLAVDYARHSHDDAEFAKRTAEFEQAQQQRDETIAHATRLAVLKEIANQTAANAATDQEVKEFHDALPPVPFADSNPFRVGTDACRLRHIAGQAECGPGRTQGVPAPAKANAGTFHRGQFRLPRAISRGSG